MSAAAVALLELLLALAARDRLTFAAAEREAFAGALLAVERWRYSVEDAAVRDRIAALQLEHGGPTSGSS